jgi:hypothetical protein
MANINKDMKKKQFSKIICCLLLLANVHIAYATEWCDYNYEFPYFSYKARQLLGTEAKIPDMFLVAAQMNTYVKNKIDDGTLKKKPVKYTIFDMDNSGITRKRFFLEVYETHNAYYININWGSDFIVYFTCEELIKTVDYFAHPDFKPFYCIPTISYEASLSELSSINLATEIYFKNIDPLVGQNIHQQIEAKTYDLYTMDDLKIQYTGSEFRVRWGNEDLGIVLEHPISIPVQFKNRVLFASSEYLYVFEGKTNIKKIRTKGRLWELGMGDEVSNRLTVAIYSDWLNIYRYDDKPIYSYSYSKNRFYELE